MSTHAALVTLIAASQVLRFELWYRRVLAQRDRAVMNALDWIWSGLSPIYNNSNSTGNETLPSATAGFPGGTGGGGPNAGPSDDHASGEYDWFGWAFRSSFMGNWWDADWTWRVEGGWFSSPAGPGTISSRGSWYVGLR